MSMIINEEGSINVPVTNETNRREEKYLLNYKSKREQPHNSLGNSLLPSKKVNKSTAFNRDKLLQCVRCAKHFANHTDLEVHFESHTAEQLTQLNPKINRLIMGRTLLNEAAMGIKTETESQVFNQSNSTIGDKQNTSMQERSKVSTGKRVTTFTGRDIFDKPVQCNRCTKRCINSADLLIHMKTHTVQQLSQWKPNTKRFVMRRTILNETEPKIQTPTEAIVLECDHCSKRFLSQTALESHLVTHRFKCDLCNKVFATKYTIIRHIYEHFGVKRHKCRTCHIAFCTRKNLKCHLTEHAECTSYDCQVCDEPFQLKEGLRTHMLRRHKNNEESPVVKSNEMFSNSSAQESHMEMVTVKLEIDSDKNEGVEEEIGIKTITVSEDPTESTQQQCSYSPDVEVPCYKCQLCFRCFSQKKKFEAHVRRHKKTQYQCHVCLKTYIRRNNFQDHMKLHPQCNSKDCKHCLKGLLTDNDSESYKKEKPYKCHACPKGYTIKKNMEEHVKTHAVKTFYICKVCEKGFSSIRALQSHERTHMPWCQAC